MKILINCRLLTNILVCFSFSSETIEHIYQISITNPYPSNCIYNSKSVINLRKILTFDMRAIAEKENLVNNSISVSIMHKLIYSLFFGRIKAFVQSLEATTYIELNEKKTTSLKPDKLLCYTKYLYT